MLRHERALRRDVGVERVEFGARAHDVASRLGRGILCVSQPARDLVDLGADLVDHGLRHRREGWRIVAIVVAEERQALPREREETPDALLHALETERDAARPVDRLGALVGLELLDAQPERVELVLQDESLGVPLLLAAGVARELLAEADELVGEQPRLRVADDRRDGGGFACDLGLTSEGLELASQLAGEIAQTREVRLHRIELAERLLLAAPVLEDARGLFDEPAAILRGCLQDGVEPPLSDDDVHLAAETRVAEQLLHVEQPAGVAVDRVLARPVAEERAADRDLGVLDRQCAVGVVDRELHLGAAERAARGGAREDDVLHLAAAERLGPLLAHDPGEGVDHVRLARPVGSDDARDPGFEREGRRLRERLEPFERHALQVHGRAPSRGLRISRQPYPTALARPGRRAEGRRPAPAVSPKSLTRGSRLR